MIVECLSFYPIKFNQKFYWIKMSDDKQKIRQYLKQIKEFISQKDYKSTLKNCARILKIDANNYFACVYAGYSYTKLEQYNQAERAYKKATEISPNSKEGWLGLLEIFTSREEEKLIPVFEKLIQIFEKYYFFFFILNYFRNEKKWKEYAIQLVNLLDDKDEKVFLFF